MRKFVLAAAAAGAALTLAACSDGVDDTADTAIIDDGTMADIDSNTDAMVDGTEEMVDDGAMMVDDAAVDAEAAMQDETEMEAAID